MGKSNKRTKSDTINKKNNKRQKKNKPEQLLGVELNDSNVNGDENEQAVQNANNVNGDENEQAVENGSNLVEIRPEQDVENNCNGNANEAEKSVQNVLAENVVEAGATGNTIKKKTKLHRRIVFVRGIPYKMKEDEIRQRFKDCGIISWVIKDEFRGTALIKFETDDAVKSALALHGMKIMENRHVKIEPCNMNRRKIGKLLKDPCPKFEGPLTAFIGNIPWDVKDHDITEFFEGSKIKSVKLALQNKTGKCRGFGHVLFVDEESLENALKKDQMELLGRPIKIWYSVLKPKRKKFRVPSAKKVEVKGVQEMVNDI